jgi:hypothetical protein
MPAKSLIAFKKQPLQQLGIDPAFEEAGSGMCCLPAMTSTNEKSVSGAHRHRGSFARMIQGKRSNNLRIARDVQQV